MAKLTIWHGKSKPMIAVGVNQCCMLGFFNKYPGWHYIGKDRATKNAVFGLYRKGYLMRNACGQYRINYGTVPV